MRALVLLLSCSVALPAMAGTIYKKIDAKGHVIFTDQPTSGAQPVEVEPGSSYTPPPIDPAPRDEPQPPAAADSDTGSDRERAQPVAYESIAITQPASEASFWEIDVPVAVSVVPALQAGHEVEFRLDGSAVGQNTAGGLTLSGLDRGEHSVQAAIVDRQGRELISTDPVKFYVHRPSLLQPQRRSAR